MKQLCQKSTGLVLVIAICAVVLYTAAQIVALLVFSITFPDTLTGCWYAFWGTELVALCSITCAKFKHGVGQSCGGSADWQGGGEWFEDGKPGADGQSGGGTESEYTPAAPSDSAKSQPSAVSLDPSNIEVLAEAVGDYLMRRMSGGQDTTLTGLPPR